jgi:hypothetical protein
MFLKMTKSLYAGHIEVVGTWDSICADAIKALIRFELFEHLNPGFKALDFFGAVGA